MTATRQPAAIHLWSGDFASQQLAFAHLLDIADRTGSALDLDAVEVIPVAELPRRLAPYLDGAPPTCDAPMLVLLAGPPGTDPPFQSTGHLRYLGSRAGHVLRAGTAWA